MWQSLHCGQRPATSVASPCACRLPKREPPGWIVPLIVEPVTVLGQSRANKCIDNASAASADRWAESPQPALGVRELGRAAEIWSLDPETTPPELPAAARGLAVSLLHGALLPALGLPASAATDAGSARGAPQGATAGNGSGSAHAAAWTSSGRLSTTVRRSRTHVP